MGRAFEYRKATKMARWGHMARVFTKIGKEITIAVKAGGPDPDSNPRLRVLIKQAKAENMPKDNIDRAIKKATDKSAEGYKEINFEGYGPHGIAIFVETLSDNNNRTVANVRSYFTKHGGNLGTQGCLQFLFDRKCVFTCEPKEVDMDELELELIDFGVDELGQDEEGNIIMYGAFESYSDIQKYLEANNFEIKSAEFVRIPNDFKDVTPEEREGVQKLLDKIEEDEDVQNVFTNMAPEE
ncbi:MAG: YebC/PmpR family DNA-binding transcriptional regulator [Paludibacteraceae bacterium]|nr:YebC/PmpR family DNA-binding transcriptional regulator [Paludibacteraceae bacterium]